MASPGCLSSAGSCCLLWKRRHPEHVPMAPTPTETSGTRRKQTHPQHFTYSSFKKCYLGSWGSQRQHVGTPGEFRVQQEGYMTICWKFHFIPFTAEHLPFGNSDGSAEAALAGSLCRQPALPGNVPHRPTEWILLGLPRDFINHHFTCSGTAENWALKESMVPGSSEGETPGYAVEMETIGKELGGIQEFEFSIRCYLTQLVPSTGNTHIPSRILGWALGLPTNPAPLAAVRTRRIPNQKNILRLLSPWKQKDCF